MHENSGIEWTETRWDPISGTVDARFNERGLDQPIRCKAPRRIAVCARGDLFHESVPDEWIDRVFAVMALTPRHTYQVLTKHPERARAWFARPDIFDRVLDQVNRLRVSHSGYNFCHIGVSDPAKDPLTNVWIGASVENQAMAEARIPVLLEIPARIRWLACEPLLGPLDLNEIRCAQTGIIDALRGLCGTDYPLQGRCKRLDWVVVSGDSGPGSRPMHPDWPLSIMGQCMQAGVKFFFKQWGDWAPEEIASREESNAAMRYIDIHGRTRAAHAGVTGGSVIVQRLGLKRAGRRLDGLTWNGMPGEAMQQGVSANG